MNSQGLQSQRTADLRSGFGNPVLSSGALAIDATASKFKTTATVAYAIDGIFKSKAAATALVFSTGHATVPDGYSCLFAVCVDAAGAVSTVQGDLFKAETDTMTGATRYRAYVPTTDAAGNVLPKKSQRLVDFNCELLVGQPPVPPAVGTSVLGIPENVAVIGAIKVAASGADFVPGTTDLTGIGTYVNLAGVLPAATNL